jgi:hypothetical protein
MNWLALVFAGSYAVLLAVLALACRAVRRHLRCLRDSGTIAQQGRPVKDW